MAAERAPAFQFYPKDFLSDERVRLMSHTERGIYITLLCLCWLERSLPAAPEHLAKLVEVPVPRFRRLWEGSLSACFILGSDGRLHQKRLDEERLKQEHYSRRQSDRGKDGARARWHGQESGIAQASTPDSAGIPVSTTRPMPSDGSSSSSSSSVFKEEQKNSVRVSGDPFADAQITERAGRFIERYQVLYQTHRKGARYVVKPARDYQEAVSLCATWPDDRLDQLAEIFLTTNHEWAENGSRTIGQFRALASWCDGKLAEHEAKPA